MKNDYEPSRLIWRFLSTYVCPSQTRGPPMPPIVEPIPNTPNVKWCTALLDYNGALRIAHLSDFDIKSYAKKPDKNSAYRLHVYVLVVTFNSLIIWNVQNRYCLLFSDVNTTSTTVTDSTTTCKLYRIVANISNCSGICTMLFNNKTVL